MTGSPVRPSGRAGFNNYGSNQPKVLARQNLILHVSSFGNRDKLFLFLSSSKSREKENWSINWTKKIFHLTLSSNREWGTKNWLEQFLLARNREVRRDFNFLLSKNSCVWGEECIGETGAFHPSRSKREEIKIVCIFQLLFVRKREIKFL